jgi:hypothetical protein
MRFRSCRTGSCDVDANSPEIHDPASKARDAPAWRPLRPGRVLRVRILLGPAPSLHCLLGSLHRSVRQFLRYYGQVRLGRSSSAMASGLPDAVRVTPHTDSLEISRFPCRRRLRMPGSTTARGRPASRIYDARRGAFCRTEDIGTPKLVFAVQWLAYALPCQRFGPVLANRCAWLGAGVARYAFTVEVSHLLPPAGLPAHPSTPSV